MKKESTPDYDDRAWSLGRMLLNEREKWQEERVSDAYKKADLFTVLWPKDFNGKPLGPLYEFLHGVPFENIEAAVDKAYADYRKVSARFLLEMAKARIRYKAEPESQELAEYFEKEASK